MTLTATTPLVPRTHRLEPLERLQLRDQLQDLWRSTVEQITESALRFHSIETEASSAEEAPLVARKLAHLRLDLTEIEAAMQRMDAGCYGGCEGCDRAVPRDQLATLPQRRCCAGCNGSAQLSLGAAAPTAGRA